MNPIKVTLFVICCLMMFVGPSYANTCEMSLKPLLRFNGTRLIEAFRGIDETNRSFTLSSVPSLAAGISSRADLSTDRAQFYETYRHHAKYLEEYSTKLDRQTDPFLITRYHSHYKWLVDTLSWQTRTPQKSASVLSEMAQVNQWIVSEGTGGLPETRTITSVSKEAIGSVELRVATYLELKLLHRPFSSSEVWARFHRIKELEISDEQWPKFDEIVSQDLGTSYAEAKSFLVQLEQWRQSVTGTSDERSARVLADYAPLVHRVLKKKNLNLDSAGLNHLIADYVKYSEDSETQFSLSNFLNLMSVGGSSLTSSEFRHILNQARQRIENIPQEERFNHQQLKAHEALSLIYLKMRNGHSGSDSEAALWEQSFKEYQAAFSSRSLKPRSSEPWMLEELFLKVIHD